MKMGEDIIEYIKSYVVEDLLDDDDDGYEYYIDKVALAIDPTVVRVFLYTNVPKEIVAHLLKGGLVFSNNVDNCQTMTYRDMLYVTITTNKERYETMENDNLRIESISLDNIVMWAKDRGYKNTDIITLLHKTIICEI